MDKANDELTASEALLLISRVWLFMAGAALVLYFIVKAIESHRIHVMVESHRYYPGRGYHVPVEHDEALQYEKEHPLSGHEKEVPIE